MKKYDVVILGGGISGSLFALNLIKKKKSLSILILDKERQSKPKVGEATADLSSIFLNRLGINHLLSQQQQKTGLRFIFNEQNSSDKKDVLEFASPSFKTFANGYHLNRSVFDSKLLLECEKKGVTVFRPIELNSANFKSNKCILKVSCNGINSEIESCWFIDASGRFRYIKKKFNWADKKISLNTGAISAHFTSMSAPSNWDREDTPYWLKNALGSKSYATTHFLKSNSWWWLIKLDEFTSSLGVVYNKNKISVRDPEAYFLESIKQDAILCEVTKNAQISKINHLDSLPYICTKMHQNNVAVLGDANAFIDPLFSPGLEITSQQNEHLVFLLLDYFKNNKKNTIAWKKYEDKFLKTYLDRSFVYSNLYQFMHSYDLFSNATQLLFFGYQSFAVLPLRYFPSRIKNPLRFYKVDGWIFKKLFKRYHKIVINREKNNRKSSSLKQPVSYSGINIPNGFYILFKPIHLGLIWLYNYIKIESTEFYFLIKRKIK
ncbi:MAG: tryptophan 7-halogenase [Flavobacteriales bacterium]|nr:tryptophan 7-halogenase [Flavobacteriales bacterium]